MERTKIGLDSKAFERKYNKIMSEDKGKKIGSIIFVTVLLVVIVLFCSWQLKWFDLLSQIGQSKPFTIEVSKVTKNPISNQIIVYVIVEGDGKVSNTIPTQIKFDIASYKNGTLESKLEKQDVDVISGALVGKIEKGLEITPSVQEGTHEITPFIIYYDSNKEKQTITGKTQVYIWDEKGFYKEES